MTKLYTARLPKTLSFLSFDPPENVDFSQYQQTFFNVNGNQVTVHVGIDLLNSLRIESQNVLPSILHQSIYESIESQDSDLVYTLSLDRQFIDIPSADEINARIEEMRRVGFEVTEQDI
jgi:hypothetical protein